MKVSVAMAVYEGDKYLSSQIDSILKQLSLEDELVVSLNPSNDDSEKILKQYCDSDTRVHLYITTEKGILANFENAIRHCHNEIIFLSDQDDIWMDNKVEKVKEKFIDGVLLVEHDCANVNENLESLDKTLFKSRHPRDGYIRNLMYNGYQGSCMAFHKSLLSYILPIPKNVAMHDQWIGLLAESVGKISYVDEILMYYRRHAESNTDDHRLPIEKKLHNVVTMHHEVQKRLKLCRRKRRKD